MLSRRNGVAVVLNVATNSGTSAPTVELTEVAVPATVPLQPVNCALVILLTVAVTELPTRR